MEKKSRILIVGGTGKLGFEIAKASLRSSHPTFALIRDESFSDPHKSHKLQTLSDSGATLLKGSLEDETRLIEAIKQVDVVICAVSSKQVLLQKLLISAIKQAGCVKKFIPSEFGVDPCKTRISGLDHNFYARKAEIRCLVEAEGIPYTYICCNFFMSYLLPSIVQPGLKSPPRDKVKIFGDKNAKGVFMKESDVASFTISAVDDPRTLNKVLHLRPRGNVYSMNELVEIWESKIGKKLEKIYVPEEELLKKIKETPYPDNMDMVFIYSAFVKGDHTYFDIESSGGVDGTKLYPHLKYTTIRKTRGNGFNDNNDDNNTNSDVMNFVRAITNELRNQPRRENNKAELIAKFQKLKSQKFFGEPNPYSAEVWIRQVKKILETLEIQNEQDKVSLASFLFEGEADFWWTMIKESRQVAELSW